MENDFWVMKGINFKSRLLHCFGDPGVSITDPQTAVDLIKFSGTDFITLYTHGDISSIKSIDDFPIGYFGIKFGDIKDRIDTEGHTLLVNTNHALSVNEAVEKAITGATYANTRMIKLEVLNEARTKPVNNAVFEAAVQLINKGYDVLPIIDRGDIQLAKELEKIGCLCVRVLMSDIGSEKGLTDIDFMERICKEIKIPVIAEGGLKTPQDAYNAMALGASAVLVNAAIFAYESPIRFIKVLRDSIIAGRGAYLCNLTRKERSSI